MKTTIYELLGMIKDGKAPQKIVFNNDEYEYNKKGYLDTYSGDWLFDVYDITDILNDEVEILETTITYKQDEKITLEDFKNLGYSLSKIKDKLQEGWEEAKKEDKKIEKLFSGIRYDENGNRIHQTYSIKNLADKINEIIDYIQKD